MAHSANNNHQLFVHQLPKAEKYWVAYSGGSDSTALLHYLSKDSATKNKIYAIHINHGLQQPADQWEAHCQQFCQSLDIPCKTIRVKPHNSSELSARNARIKAYQKICKPNHILLTAHHQDDQIETFLFRLIRGSGLNGLTTMALESSHQNLKIFRPLLNTSKQSIIKYLEKKNLQWVSDPSNDQTHYARNAIRHNIIPHLLEYSSNSKKLIERSIHNLQLSYKLLQHFIPCTNPLQTEYLNNISSDNSLFCTLIYQWLSHFTLPMPDKKQLQQFCLDIKNAAADKQPSLLTKYYELRYWKEEIYAIKPITRNQSQETIEWQKDSKLELGKNRGKLIINDPKHLPYKVRFGQTGEKIKLQGHRHHQKVKKIFQQNNITPWERQITPYIYQEEKLIAVGEKWIESNTADFFLQQDIKLSWEKPNQLL